MWSDPEFVRRYKRNERIYLAVIVVEFLVLVVVTLAPYVVVWAK